MDRGTARRINRAHWDALASAHGQDAYYDSEALAAGADTLSEAEAAGVREAVGAVAGIDVLHLQCHIGFDSISLARRGARVVGADFSPASLEKARTLARRCEVDAAPTCPLRPPRRLNTRTRSPRSSIPRSRRA